MSGKKMSSLKLGGVKSMIQLLIRHRHIYIITKTVSFFIIDYVLVTVSFIFIENASPIFTSVILHKVFIVIDTQI